MAPPQPAVNPALAGRIQGFGNVNPPPLEEENAKTVAKRAVSNLGNMVGEELALTVDDFRQKGAVGAVKDAVADAGDLLIDGVSGVLGWIRGDPPPEEEDEGEKSEKAQAALAQGPAGAAYGVSQPSPTGGINAVWVMPDEADPNMLAQVAAQAKPSSPQGPMQVPGGPMIQPYVPHSMSIPGGPAIQPYSPQAPFQAPGGPMIQPYVPAGKGQRAPFGAGGGPLSPAGHLHPNFPGAVPSLPQAGQPASGATGIRGLIEKVAKGETIAGPDVAKRLISQAGAAKFSAKQLGEALCERTRRLYLGLDSSCSGDTDAAILRLLGLVDALAQEGSSLSKETVAIVVGGIREELLSLNSSSQHKAAAQPMLKRLGLVKAMPEAIDLLGGEEAVGKANPSGVADLLGDEPPTAAAAPRKDELLDLL